MKQLAPSPNDVIPQIQVHFSLLISKSGAITKCGRYPDFIKTGNWILKHPTQKVAKSAGCRAPLCNLLPRDADRASPSLKVNSQKKKL